MLNIVDWLETFSLKILFKHSAWGTGQARVANQTLAPLYSVIYAQHNTVFV